MGELKKNGIPLYVQVKEILKQEIEDGKFKIGQAIPTEPEFMKRFNISRATVRQAISDLVLGGYLEREQGRGTFVSKQRFDVKLDKFYSFTKDMSKRGMNPQSRLVEFEIIPQNFDISSKIDLNEIDQVIKLVRLRSALNEVIMVETTYLSRSMFPDLTREDVLKGSLYAVLENKYNSKLSNAVEYFEPILVGSFAAPFLKVSETSPALFLERIGSTKDGKRVELSQSVIRGDRCRYVVELR